MLIRLLPWAFLFIFAIYIFYVTYRYFNRTLPENGSKEDLDNNNFFI
jgi:hypothetical protein